MVRSISVLLPNLLKQSTLSEEMELSQSTVAVSSAETPTVPESGNEQDEFYPALNEFQDRMLATGEFPSSEIEQLWSECGEGSNPTNDPRVAEVNSHMVRYVDVGRTVGLEVARASCALILDLFARQGTLFIWHIFWSWNLLKIIVYWHCKLSGAIG